jgi:hypothetical protein
VEVEQLAPDHLELVWQGAEPGSTGLVVRLWGAAGAPTQWELPLASDEGRMRFDPPPGSTRLCAALGRLCDGVFEPVARSAIITLVDR